jgi:hypothetical protein
MHCPTMQCYTWSIGTTQNFPLQLDAQSGFCGLINVDGGDELVRLKRNSQIEDQEELGEFAQRLSMVWH